MWRAPSSAVQEDQSPLSPPKRWTWAPPLLWLQIPEPNHQIAHSGGVSAPFHQGQSQEHAIPSRDRSSWEDMYGAS